MNIIHLSREYSPFAGAGGLKEVVTGICEALSSEGENVSAFIPLYGFVKLEGLKKISRFHLTMGGELFSVTIWLYELNGVKIYLLDHEIYGNKRNVYTYTREDEEENPLHGKGLGFVDNDLMNVLLQRVFVEFLFEGERPDIVHLHDAHTGFVPALVMESERYRGFFSETRFIQTIHNAGEIYHQKLPLKRAVELTELPVSVLEKGVIKGECDPFFLSALYADMSTVSPWYAEEILKGIHDKISGKIGAFYRKHNISLRGITNGVSLKRFHEFEEEPFFDLNTGVTNKKHLKEQVYNLLKNPGKGLRVFGSLDCQPHWPLFVFQGRVTSQKGIEDFIGAVKKRLAAEENSQFLIMGDGEARYEGVLEHLAESPLAKGRFAYISGYERYYAYLTYVAGDFFLIPSVWEPCGLTDFEAQLAGSIPIVRRTGGLKKVEHNVTGFSYSGSARDLARVLAQAAERYYYDRAGLALIRKKAYEKIAEHYTWDRVVFEEYLPWYKELLGGKG